MSIKKQERTKRFNGGFTITELVIVLVILGMVFAVIAPQIILGIISVISVVVHITFGWSFFLWDMFQRIEFNSMLIVQMLLFVLIFLVGSHLFCSRLTARIYPGNYWKKSWSMIGVTALFLLFIVSISTIGVIHQVKWLMADEMPFFVSNDFRVIIRNGRFRQSVREAQSAVEQYYLTNQALPDDNSIEDTDERYAVPGSYIKTLKINKGGVIAIEFNDKTGDILRKEDADQLLRAKMRFRPTVMDEKVLSWEVDSDEKRILKAWSGFGG